MAFGNIFYELEESHALYLAFVIIAFAFLLIVIKIAKSQKKPKKSFTKRKYHLNKRHRKFIKAFNKLSVERKKAFQDYVLERSKLLSLPTGYNECLFSTNTHNRKYYIDEDNFYLLLYFTSVDEKEKTRVLRRIEEWRTKKAGL